MPRRTGKAVTDTAQSEATTNEVQLQLQSVIETNAPVLADNIVEQTLVSAFGLMQSGYCGPKTRALLESFGGGVSPLEQWGNRILEIQPEVSYCLTESTT